MLSKLKGQIMWVAAAFHVLFYFGNQNNILNEISTCRNKCPERDCLCECICYWQIAQAPQENASTHTFAFNYCSCMSLRTFQLQRMPLRRRTYLTGWWQLVYLYDINKRGLSMQSSYLYISLQLYTWSVSCIHIVHYIGVHWWTWRTASHYNNQPCFVWGHGWILEPLKFYWVTWYF